VNGSTNNSDSVMGHPSYTCGQMLPEERNVVARSRAAKILVTGAYGTGKSTLVRHLVRELSQSGTSVARVDEVPRRCPYALNRDQTPLASAWLIGEQIRCEVEAATADVDVVICDRGMPDFISHTTPLRPQGEQDVFLIASVIDVARAWSRTYQLAFWASIDPGRPIEADGMRVVDRDYQQMLEREIVRTYGALGVRVRELPRELNDRVRFAVDAVRDILQR
jgi:GTPase SAR1 family protein